ncbi:kinase-like protein [Calocera cornea HHB12733]|uniref:Kinase-like protein n=1 Tax=Calocera cornea HHB12733 TaxID=1353952 RepID=A0A165G2X6_9BASI|nr:kinase-like protein [Calocera cornea HHB12733]
MDPSDGSIRNDVFRIWDRITTGLARPIFQMVRLLNNRPPTLLLPDDLGRDQDGLDPRGTSHATTTNPISPIPSVIDVRASSVTTPQARPEEQAPEPQFTVQQTLPSIHQPDDSATRKSHTVIVEGEEFDVAQAMKDIRLRQEAAMKSFPQEMRTFRTDFTNRVERVHPITIASDLDLTRYVYLRSSPPTSSVFFARWKGSYFRLDDPLNIRAIVALKSFRNPNILSEQANQQHLMDEIKLWKTLSHPNVLPVLGVAQPPSNAAALCVVSPWMKNGDVMTYLKINPGADRFALLRGIAEGLLYLHEHDPCIVHGDIRGSNVLINDAGEALLCDFGLFHYVTPFVEPAAVFTEFLRWRAPETFDGSQVAVESLVADIFSLGMCFYEIMTGNEPFKGHPYAIFTTALLSARRPQLPSEWQEDGQKSQLAETLRKCWNQDPLQRPTAREVAESFKLTP